jgi:hypothetical protein
MTDPDDQAKRKFIEDGTPARTLQSTKSDFSELAGRN